MTSIFPANSHRSALCLAGVVTLTLTSWAASSTAWSWTKRLALADRGSFDAVACASAEWCVALVGGAATVRLHGATWSMPVPVEHVAASDAPSALACVSTTRCVTFDGLGRVLTFDGRRWSEPVLLEPPSRGTIDAISCAGIAFCAVADSNGDASFFDGRRWSTLAPVADSGGIAALSCPAVGLCYAVDNQSDEVYRYAHHRWSISAQLNLSTPQGGSEPNTLNAISCGTPELCLALDDFGDAFVYDGSWAASPHTFDNIQLGNDEVSCTAARRCVIVDDSNDLVTYDDGSWSTPRRLDTSRGQLVDVSCAPGARTRCVAVDGGGGYFIGDSPPA